MVKAYLKREFKVDPDTKKRFDNFREGLIPFSVGGFLASFITIMVFDIKFGNLDPIMSMLSAFGINILAFIFLLVMSHVIETFLSVEESYIELPDKKEVKKK